MKKSAALAPIELIFQEVKLTCPIQDGHRMVPVKLICQIIDVDFIYQKLFGFKKQISQTTSGYGDSMIQSLGLLFLGVLLVALFAFLLLLFKKLLNKNKRLNQIKDFVYSRLFFNAIIRLFIQSYLTLVLAAYLNIVKIYKV